MKMFQYLHLIVSCNRKWNLETHWSCQFTSAHWEHSIWIFV